MMNKKHLCISRILERKAAMNLKLNETHLKNKEMIKTTTVIKELLL